MRQLDADTVEIVKRRDQNFGFFYKYFGSTQKGFYERVIIDRKKKTVAVDRIDGNWWHDEPFMGRRDLFYIENREGQSTDGQLTFVRHDFWIPTLWKF